MGKIPKRSKLKRSSKKRSPAASVRKGSREEMFFPMVRESEAGWRKYKEGLQEANRLASEDPVGFAMLLRELLNYQRRISRRYLYANLGFRLRSTPHQAFKAKISGDVVRAVRVNGYNSLDLLQIVRPERYPRNPYEEYIACRVLAGYVLAEATYAAMRDVGWELSEAGYEKPVIGSVMCQIFIEMYGLWPSYAGMGAEPAREGSVGDLHPLVKKALTAQLTGWVSASLSLTKNKRLKAVLEEEGEAPFEKLLRELPATTIIEWGNLQPKEHLLKGLVRRVALHLEKQGGEATRLARSGKLADAQFESPVDQPANEPALETFMLREELRTIRNSAGLSQREDQVLELLLENCTAREIAGKLKLTEGAVKQYKSRTLEKLRQAAGQ